MESKMGRPRVKSLNFESHYDYKKNNQNNLYRTNPEYAAKKKLHYYKKLYKENEDFNKILENNNNIIEILLEVIKFHHLNKINKINLESI